MMREKKIGIEEEGNEVERAEKGRCGEENACLSGMKNKEGDEGSVEERRKRMEMNEKKGKGPFVLIRDGKYRGREGKKLRRKRMRNV